MKQYIRDKIQTKLKELNGTLFGNCVKPAKLLYDESVPDSVVDWTCSALSSGGTGYYELFLYRRYNIHVTNSSIPTATGDIYLHSIKFVEPAFLMPYQAQGRHMVYLNLADIRSIKLDEVLELKCHTLTN